MAPMPALAPVHEAPLCDTALRDPIEYLRFEHYRQRVLCDLLARIADDPTAPGNTDRVAWVLHYLETELVLHVADEEQDLLPLLGRRCSGADALPDISGALAQEHVSDEMLRRAVIVGLRALAEGRPLERPLDFIVRAQMLEERLRRHLVWENQTLMPLARRRLTRDDLATLGRRMMRRHRRAEGLH
ncbi:MAG TPA: hemerythrin domain-containing protein [Alphaproteobacteria bacterium]